MPSYAFVSPCTRPSQVSARSRCQSQSRGRKFSTKPSHHFSIDTCDNCNLPPSLFCCTRIISIVIQPTGRALRPYYLACSVAAWRRGGVAASSLQEVRPSTFHNLLRRRLFVVVDLPPSEFWSRRRPIRQQPTTDHNTYHNERCKPVICSVLWRLLPKIEYTPSKLQIIEVKIIVAAVYITSILFI